MQLTVERRADRTVEDFFTEWERTLRPPKVRPRTAAQYRFAFKCHVLPSRDLLRIAALTWQNLASPQDQLVADGVGAPAINRALQHGLRAMFRDAKRRGISVASNLYDRQLWQRLPESPDATPDPYNPDARRRILKNVRTKRPEWLPFVSFQFWQGGRPSEATGVPRI